MQYHIAKNGEKTGPLDHEEVYRRLVSGELKGDDLGWHEGLAEWQPLSQLVPPAPSSQLPPPAPGVFAERTAPIGATAAPEPNKTSGAAVASLVCGILGLILWFPCLPAVILGHVGLSAIKKSGGALKGRGMALTGLITGYMMIALIPIIAVMASLAVPVFNRVQEKATETKIIANAKQLVAGMHVYANEHQGSFPPDLETLYDEEIVLDRRLLEFPKRAGQDQAWEYHGAGLTTSSHSKAVVLITRKPLFRGKQVRAYVDGFVEVVKQE